MNKNIGLFVGTVAMLALVASDVSISPVTSNTRMFAAGSLTDVKGVEELKALFNRDVGRVRLVLLLSPT